jgi:hypothetical protein
MSRVVSSAVCDCSNNLYSGLLLIRQLVSESECRPVTSEWQVQTTVASHCWLQRVGLPGNRFGVNVLQHCRCA